MNLEPAHTRVIGEGVGRGPGGSGQFGVTVSGVWYFGMETLYGVHKM